MVWILAAQGAKVTHRGAHPGNDTIWRMVADLYQALLTRPRRYFTVIDGIMAGEGQGPFCPTSKHANILLASPDLLVGDLVAARLMGFDPHKIKYLEYFINKWDIMLDDIHVWCDGMTQPDFFRSPSRYLDFEVVDSWNVIKV